jgi:hypothetical protein
VRFTLTTLIALSLAVQVGDAFAKPKRKKAPPAAEKADKGDEKADDKADDKADAKDGDKKAKVQKLTAGGPTLKYEQFRRAIENKVAEKREEQIAGIKRLIDLGPPLEEVPDLKFRLAELYFEKSRHFFFEAQRSEDKALQSKNPGEKESLLDQKNGLPGRSSCTRRSAIASRSTSACRRCSSPSGRATGATTSTRRRSPSTRS